MLQNYQAGHHYDNWKFIEAYVFKGFDSHLVWFAAARYNQISYFSCYRCMIGVFNFFVKVVYFAYEIQGLLHSKLR
jgi:hypothetical protein